MHTVVLPPLAALCFVYPIQSEFQNDVVNEKEKEPPKENKRYNLKKLSYEERKAEMMIG